MVDERSSLFAEPRPAPSYVFPGRYPRAHHQIKRFQGYICLAFLCVLVSVLAILITFAILDASEAPVEDELAQQRQQRQEYKYPTVNVIRAKDANNTDNLNTLMLLAWPLADEQSPQWDISNLSLSEHNMAIKAGIIALGDKDLYEENMPTPPINSPAYRGQRAVGTTAEARKLAKRGYVENHASLELAKSYPGKLKGRWPVGNGPDTYLHSPEVTKCNFNSRYRNANGTCNNKMHPFSYGVAMIPFRRAINPDYADGLSAPRASSHNQSLPSARLLTTSIHRPSYSNDPHFTVMLAVFGQFLDHDITATALNQGQDGEPIDCCNIRNDTTMHPECFPVPIGPEDPNYQKYNMTCMNFVRSAPAPTGRFGPRQQLNQATAFIDGSVVYGHTENKVAELRTFINGTLRMYHTPDHRTLLPVSTDPRDGCNVAVENAKGQYCFDTGDQRANENLHLTSMHLIWARHHNFLAQQLHTINPHWNDERLFQEARMILGAQMQHIAYNEFLPVLLGDAFCRSIELTSNTNGRQDTYDPNVNPSIANVFASCAFRFAHTLIPGLMNVTRRNANTSEGVALHRMLFNPYSLWASGGLDTAISSAIDTPLAKSDQYFTSELTDKLFQRQQDNDTSQRRLPPTKQLPGLDLVSLNIQRGRDHGLPAYTEWRKHCHLPSVDTWEDMEHAVDPNSLEEMKNIYNDAIDVDLYTGALSEPPVDGSIIGPTLVCLLSDQFIRLKRGDSHWYERPYGPQRLTSDQLNQIFNTTLAAIICRNSDAVNESQPFVMKRHGPDNRIVACSSLDTFDFGPWKDLSNFVKIDNKQMKVLAIVNSYHESNRHS